jgi:hypothetical protein
MRRYKMKTVYVITAENPDNTRRFVSVKGTMLEAIKLIEDIKEGTNTIDVDVNYQISEQHL